jgi:hypothetical protein
MQWHIEQAAAAGATMREVLEAVEVGIEMAAAPHGLGSVRAGGDGTRFCRGTSLSLLGRRDRTANWLDAVRRT